MPAQEIRVMPPATWPLAHVCERYRESILPRECLCGFPRTHHEMKAIAISELETFLLAAIRNAVKSLKVKQAIKAQVILQDALSVAR